MEENRSDLQRLQHTLGAEWPAIARARSRSRDEFAKLNAGLAEFTGEDSSIVVFGSLARGEFTSSSDLDWTLLVDGQTYPEHLTVASDAAQWVNDHYVEPGREATFGGLSISHNLVNHIGGTDDTNRNLTQRILLLLESVPVGRSDAYTRVIRALLERYIAEDLGWSHSVKQSYIPRFLQNDIARYWRTVAVDFAYKRKDRGGDGWALRTVKLRLSRKLTYAAGLVGCFRCSMLPQIYPGFEALPPDEKVRITVGEMESFLERTPLDILAWAYLHFNLSESALPLFDSYDRFLEILDSEGRDTLKNLSLENAPGNALFEEARTLGHRFQDALDELFIPVNGGGFYGLTRTYGMF